MHSKTKSNKNVLIKPQFIIEFLKEYQLSPTGLGRIIGVQSTTIDLWASGERSVPETTGRLLLLFCRHPELMDEFKDFSGTYTEVP